MISESVRVLQATWWIAITFLTILYLSNLNAFLNSVKHYVPFNTLDEFMERKWFYLKGKYVSLILDDVSNI